MTALLLALLAAVMEAGAGLALWAAGMSALPVAISSADAATARPWTCCVKR